MAIVVTTLGTAQAKGAFVHLDYLSWAVGDVLICVAAGDTECTPYWSVVADWAYFTKDAIANNSGNVVVIISRVEPTVAALGNGIIWCDSVEAHAIAVYKVTGLNTSPLDKTKTAVSSSATPSSTDADVTTQADELLIGGIGTEGSYDDAAGTWNGDTTENNQRIGTTGGGAVSNITVAAATKIVSATGAYSADKTGITSRDWAAAIATYKGGAGVVQKMVTDSLALSDTRSIKNTLTVVDSLGVSSQFPSGTPKAFLSTSDTLTLSEQTLLKLLKSIADSLTLSTTTPTIKAVLVVSQSLGLVELIGQSAKLTVSDLLSLTQQLLISSKLSIADALSLAEALSKSEGANLVVVYDNLSVATSIAQIRTTFILSDSLSLTQSIVARASLTVFDVLSLAQQLSLSVKVQLVDALTLQEAMSFKGKLNVSDSLSLTQALSLSNKLSIQDSIALQVALTLKGYVALSDSLILSAATQQAVKLTLQDALALIETITTDTGKKLIIFVTIKSPSLSLSVVLPNRDASIQFSLRGTIITTRARSASVLFGSRSVELNMKTREAT